MNNKEYKILIVDDDNDLCEAIRRKYGREYNIVFTNNGNEALEKIYNLENIAIVISDYQMPGMNGIEYLEKMRNILPETIRVLMTGYADLSIAIDAVNRGNIFRFISKPVVGDIFKILFEECLKQYELKSIEKTEKLKTEFLSLISHEIRTPLNSIVNYLGLINDEYGNFSKEESSMIFQAVERNASRLTRTIDLLVNVSEVLTKNYKINFNLINLNNQIIMPVIDFYKQLIKDRGLDLVYSNSAEELFVLGDFYSIRNIFTNLMDNAITYTSNGEIEIRIYANGNDKLEVVIKDTGIGMSEEYLKKIFTPFEQEDSGFTRKYDGTGLGLTLVKKYAELNNIEIEIKSMKDQGTEAKLIFNNIKKYRNQE